VGLVQPRIPASPSLASTPRLDVTRFARRDALPVATRLLAHERPREPALRVVPCMDGERVGPTPSGASVSQAGHPERDPAGPADPTNTSRQTNGCSGPRPASAPAPSARRNRSQIVTRGRSACLATSLSRRGEAPARAHDEPVTFRLARRRGNGADLDPGVAPERRLGTGRTARAGRTATSARDHRPVQELPPVRRVTRQ
jgi:hypothetical protein